MGVVRLGRYRVLTHLASGGMADVMLARTEGIEGFARHVVVKRIKVEHAKDQRFIQMFLDEARLAANLHHANIVQVHDIGEAKGEYFFAMEYIHGEDLRKLLSAVSKNRAHMPLGHVCAIVSATAAGLHYAHERKGADKRPLNIVHRDVSPSNILVGYDGSVKIVDFGIAKAAMRQVETHSGSLKGKVSYMSPEQCKGEAVDRRSDVYALGVLLYELATTTRLFKGENDYLLMDAIVNGKVPLPRVRRPDVPNELSSIIMRALAVDPARRFQTADELRVALDQFVIKAGLTASQSGLATYMHKTFGERPEPWLELGDGDEPSVDGEAPTEMAKASWTETPPDELAAATDKTRAGRRTGSNAAMPAVTPRETRTSMKMGWEVEPGVEPPPPRRRKWLAVGAVPLLGVGGIFAYHVATRSPAASSAAPVAAAAAPAPTVTPIPVPDPAPPAPVVDTPPAPVAAPEPAVPAHITKTHTTSIRKPVQKVAAAVPVPPPVPAAVAPPPPQPAVAAAPPPPPAPPPPAPPAPIEPMIAQLSQATVQMVASDHSRQLSKCDGGAGELHGEIAVTFQIDGSGRVVKSQLSTSVKNPKLAGCILKAVQSWQFPKPPTGAARGVYSIDYQ
jgi:serine/threonine-protein kinase